ncbi:MAG: dihydrofolate reductase [Alphaproteobacteria bacterium]|nr:dihydrofolate reductase [Alphaproteobacteria bacterium]
MKKTAEICAIVAVGPDNVIGRGGVMPWHCKSDLYHFQKITTPYPCIFGRTTFENLPKKPLPNRLNIVVGSHHNNEYVGKVFYASSIEKAISECNEMDRIFICGGAQIYSYSLNHDLIDTMYLTIIKNPVLEQDIYKNPDVYCRFPYGIKILLNSSKWVSQPIIYPQNILPKDDGITTAEFYKCTRVR